jgi:hypothetical protein
MFLKRIGTDDKPAPVPKMDAGSLMCLAWHLKGGCYSNCLRCKANDHAHGRLNEAEEKRLCKFIDDGLAKVAKK